MGHPPPFDIDLNAVRQSVRELAARLRIAGVQGFRVLPPEPTTCCGRGCAGCVWEGHLQALQWWREDALELLDRASLEERMGKAR